MVKLESGMQEISNLMLNDLSNIYQLQAKNKLKAYLTLKIYCKINYTGLNYRVVL